jgi:regulatory protein
MNTPFKRALSSALRILTRRDHSVTELRRKLRQRQVETTLIDQVITECRRLNYLDDDRFAKGLIRYSKRKGYGPLHVRQDLSRRGLTGTAVEHMLSEAYSEQEERRIARKVGLKKLSSIRESDPSKRREKLYRFLSSRGFSKAAIADALHDVVRPSNN